MKFLNLPLLTLGLAAFAPHASATIATLGLSSQPFILTGIGANTTGQGQASISWGNCTYDGTDSHCTLSGNYTGFDGGGTYSFVVTYAGNGAFPFIALFPTPSNNMFQAQSIANFSLVITLTPTGQAPIMFYSFANFSFVYPASAVCTGVTTCAAGQVSLTQGATMNGSITGSFDPTPFIQTPGVITASAYGAFASIAPMTWIEIYGVNLATTLTQTWGAADFQGILAPTSVGGTSVMVAGKPAYVYFVSPGQVNAQVPSGVGSGPQQVTVTTAGGTSSAFTVTVNALEPGLLAPASFIIKGNQYVVALFAGTLTYDLPVNLSGVATQRARAGDVLTMYGVGFGPTTDNIPGGQVVQTSDGLQNSLQVFFGGIPATVSYSGLAPTFVGLYQFNVVVPNGVTASDTVPLTFKLNGVSGPQNLVIPIQN